MLVKISVSTSIKEYGMFERIATALDARSLVLVVDDDEARRAEFVRDLYRIYATQADYTPVIITTPVLYDRQGRMAKRYVGAVPESTFRADIESVLHE